MTTYAKYAEMYKQRLAHSQDTRVSKPFLIFKAERAGHFSSQGKQSKDG